MIRYEISITKWRRYCVQNVTKIESNGRACTFWCKMVNLNDFIRNNNYSMGTFENKDRFEWLLNALTKPSVHRSIYLSIYPAIPLSIINHYIALYRPYVPRLVHRFSAHASSAHASFPGSCKLILWPSD